MECMEYGVYGVGVRGNVAKEIWPPGRLPRRVRESFTMYRGTSLMRKSHPLGPYRTLVPRAPRRSYGAWYFFRSEVPLYREGAGSGVDFHVDEAGKTRTPYP